MVGVFPTTIEDRQYLWATLLSPAIIMDIEAKSNPDFEKGDDDVRKQEAVPTTGKRSGCVSRKCLIWTCFVLLVLLVGSLLGVLFLFFTDEDKIQGLAVCGDCHCSYADSEIKECPEKPPTEFTGAFLQSLLDLKPLYPLPTLECDPYQAGECETTFSSTVSDGNSVCAMHYMSQNSGKMCDSYWMVTYPNATAAQAAGAYVSHRGACGLCSSLQDLVVYMKYHDLTTLGQECGVKGLTMRENGVECFQEKLGMTQGCAAIWMANVRSTLHNCGGVCFTEDLFDTEYNGPAPMCALSECLQCDEDHSGDVFKAYAGRTRRRSGLISAIARPCDTIATEIRHDLPITCSPP